MDLGGGGAPGDCMTTKFAWKFKLFVKWRVQHVLHIAAPLKPSINVFPTKGGIRFKGGGAHSPGSTAYALGGDKTLQ